MKMTLKSDNKKVKNLKVKTFEHVYANWIDYKPLAISYEYSLENERFIRAKTLNAYNPLVVYTLMKQPDNIFNIEQINNLYVEAKNVHEKYSLFKEEAIDTSKWSEEKREKELKEYRDSYDKYVDYIDDYRQYQSAKKANERTEDIITIIENKGIIPATVTHKDIMTKYILDTAFIIQVFHKDNIDMVKLAVKCLKDIGATVKQTRFDTVYSLKFKYIEYTLEINKETGKPNLFIGS